MKNILFSIVFIFSSFNFSNAQSTEPPKFPIVGITGGLNASSFDKTSNNILGFHLGMIFEKAISAHHTFNPELIFSLQGAEFKQTNYNSTLTDTYSLNYLNMPLMFRLFASEKFFFQAGPQLGMLLYGRIDNSSETTSWTGSKSTQSSTTDFYDRSMDLGINLGLGFKFENVSISARYCYELPNISNAPNGYKNRTFQFSISKLIF